MVPRSPETLECGLIKKAFGLAVLLLIVGMTVPKTRVILLDVIRPVTDRVRNRMVPGRLKGMGTQLDIRVKRIGYLPEGEEWGQWLRSGYSGSPLDPWGNQYYSTSIRRGGFVIGSMGADGVQGTDDDITETH